MTWRVGNAGTGKRRWFVYQETTAPGRRYHEGRTGHAVRYATSDGAQRVADRLNGGGGFFVQLDETHVLYLTRTQVRAAQMKVRRILDRGGAPPAALVRIAEAVRRSS